MRASRALLRERRSEGRRASGQPVPVRGGTPSVAAVARAICRARARKRRVGARHCGGSHTWRAGPWYGERGSEHECHTHKPHEGGARRRRADEFLHASIDVTTRKMAPLSSPKRCGRSRAWALGSCAPRHLAWIHRPALGSAIPYGVGRQEAQRRDRGATRDPQRYPPTARHGESSHVYTAYHKCQVESQVRSYLFIVTAVYRTL
jgi:hypothetical protein